MHKIFAKPVFLGKKVLFLPQCHSTNEELSDLIKKNTEPEGFIIYTDHQKNGKGQRGNIWLAESGKNILMSVLLRPHFLSPNQQHYLNLIVGLSAIDALSCYLPKDQLTLKWPNDIYVKEKKIGGILIENNLRGSKLESAVVGIGINLNQKGFNLQKATSVFLEVGIELSREEVMEDFLFALEKWYLKLKSGKFEEIADSYHEKLLWKDEYRMFKSQEIEFQGVIQGIDKLGRLVVKTEKEERIFNIKEIEFLR